MDSSTKQLLRDYQSASRKLQESFVDEMPDDRSTWLYNRHWSLSRELVSRCIINNDPRSIMFLIAELETLLQITGHSATASLLATVCTSLANYYMDRGHL